MSPQDRASQGSVPPGAGEQHGRGRGASPEPAGVKAPPGATALSLASHALAAAGELEMLARVRSDRLRLRARRMLSRAPGKALGGIILGVGAVCATWLAADVVRRHPRLAMATGALAGAAGTLAVLRALTSPVRSLRLARWLVPLMAGGRRPGRRVDIARHLKAGLRLWARRADAPDGGARP